MKKMLLTTVIAGFTLSGCGGSSGSDDAPSSPVTGASVLGTWDASQACQYDDESPMYYTESLVISASEIEVQRVNFDSEDYDCSGTGTADTNTYSYSAGELIAPANGTGIQMLQLDVNSLGKIALYVSPGSKHLVVTESDDDNFPTSFRIDEHYVKRGASFAPSGATVTVLHHSGMNLTSGVVSDDESSHDIATIAWSPTNLGPLGGESENGWGAGIWIRPNYMREVDPEAPVYIKDMGSVSLSSVNAIPSGWPEEDVDRLDPLAKGHVYVVRLLNGGYAKLRILHEPDTESDGWSVLMEYQLMN